VEGSHRWKGRKKKGSPLYLRGRGKGTLIHHGTGRRERREAALSERGGGGREKDLFYLRREANEGV